MKKLYSERSTGTYGSFALEINVDTGAEVNLSQSLIIDATYKAAKIIKDAVLQAAIAINPDAQENRRIEREGIVALFDAPIYVVEIPNGYCSESCCKHLPWFDITTSIGHFIVGWRKRVLVVDWNGTVGTKTSDEIFADLTVTKEARMIHAWNLVDAKSYIKTIFGTVSA